MAIIDVVKWEANNLEFCKKFSSNALKKVTLIITFLILVINAIFGLRLTASTHFIVFLTSAAIIVTAILICLPRMVVLKDTFSISLNYSHFWELYSSSRDVFAKNVYSQRILCSGSGATGSRNFNLPHLQLNYKKYYYGNYYYDWAIL